VSNIKNERCRTHELIDDSGIREESVHLSLNFGGLHHVLNVVGIVRVDSHLGERVESDRLEREGEKSVRSGEEEREGIEGKRTYPPS
jgi:hypothetical protein